MARRPLTEREVRKVGKNNSSYFVTLPIDEIRKLGWRVGQRLVVVRSGRHLIVKDWRR